MRETHLGSSRAPVLRARLFGTALCNSTLECVGAGLTFQTHRSFLTVFQHERKRRNRLGLIEDACCALTVRRFESGLWEECGGWWRRREGFAADWLEHEHNKTKQGSVLEVVYWKVAGTKNRVLNMALPPTHFQCGPQILSAEISPTVHANRTANLPAELIIKRRLSRS